MGEEILQGIIENSGESSPCSMPSTAWHAVPTSFHPVLQELAPVTCSQSPGNWFWGDPQQAGSGTQVCWAPGSMVKFLSW